MIKKAIDLKGFNICLRPMTENDVPLRVLWFNDPDVNRNLILPEPIEVQKTLEWQKKASRDITRYDCIIESKAQCPIGCIGLRHINYHNRSACYYIVIGEKTYWGKGFGKEASVLLFDWAFKTLKLNKIWSNVASYNTGSLALLKKLGFQQEGYLREEEIVEDKKIDVVRFGLLASEFQNKS